MTAHPVAPPAPANYNTPAQTAAAAVEAGVAKATLPLGKMVVGGFLAGAYIAFGGLLAIVASAGMPAATWGGLPTLITGITFSLGLVLVVIAGADLLTGNMMLLPLALLSRRIGAGRVALNWVVIFVANFLGALFVAWLLAFKTGVIGDIGAKEGTAAFMNHARTVAMVSGKAITETHLQVFLRAIGCNWLVCLGVWLGYAARDVAGKILGIMFPITAFVAMGFDHVVANMFFLPLGMFVHTPGLTWGKVSWNLAMALLGNLVGAIVFVACSYWYLYLHGTGTSAATAHAGGVQVARPEAGSSAIREDAVTPGHGDPVRHAPAEGSVPASPNGPRHAAG